MSYKKPAYLDTLNQIDGVPCAYFITEDGRRWIYPSYAFGVKDEDVASDGDAKTMLNHHLNFSIKGLYLSIKSRRTPDDDIYSRNEPLIVWRRRPDFGIDESMEEKCWKISARLIVIPAEDAEYVRSQLESNKTSPNMKGEVDDDSN